MKELKVAVVANDWKKVSTVNNLLNSLFKQVDLIIGDRVRTSSHLTYPYKTDFEMKLGISKDAKESFLTSGLWYKDSDTNPEELNQIRSEFIAPLPNSSDSDKGRILDLMGRIYLPLFEQRKLLLGGCTIQLKFIPNDPSFYLMCSNDIRVKSVEFIDASLYLQRSRVSKPLMEGIHKGLEKSDVKYPLRESFVIPITIGKGIIDTILDNVHNGQLPRRAFVAFVDHNAFNGSYLTNPFNYQNFGLNHLAFYLNGIQYPEKAFTPDFDNQLYIREFMSLFESTNQDSTDSCINVDRKSFVKGNYIFAVNFAPDLSSGCCSTGYANPIKYGNLRLQLRFKAPLEKTITTLVYSEYDTILEIDQEKKPIYDLN